MSLLTRIPVDLEEDLLKQRGANAFWSFPIVGLMVGTLVFGVMYGSAFYFSPELISIFSVVTIVLLTGAIHEDGLADCADGFWGSTWAHLRLQIMSDSHLGVYGTSAIVFSYTIKAVCFYEIIGAGAALLIIPVFAVSRSWMVLLMWYMPNAKQDGLAASVGTPDKLIVLAALAISVALAVAFGTTAMIACVFTALGAYIVYQKAMRRINGYTGDVLGAAQVLSEISGLLALTVLI